MLALQLNWGEKLQDFRSVFNGRRGSIRMEKLWSSKQNQIKQTPKCEISTAAAVFCFGTEA